MGHTVPTFMMPLVFWALSGNTEQDFVEQELPALAFWAVLILTLVLRGKIVSHKDKGSPQG
jgi:hypothetical protein